MPAHGKLVRAANDEYTVPAAGHGLGKFRHLHRQQLLHCTQWRYILATIDMQEYRGHQGLPLLAGYCSLAQATRTGLSVNECVRRLKRYHYAFNRLHEILIARMTAEPIYEFKTGFSHCTRICAPSMWTRCARASPKCANRRWASRTCPTRLSQVFFDEILARLPLGYW